MNYPYIIAEIGSNWRTLDIAKKQIEAAKECGADAAKFQMFTNKELYGYDDGSKCWGLPRELVDPLALHCQSVGIDFMCTAFSIDGYKFIDPYVKMHKIASCEADWPELLVNVNALGKPFLRSYGLIDKSKFEFKNEISMLCCAKYPAEASDYAFNDAFIEDIVWGLSDHTMNNDLAIIASCVGTGAVIFEKHFDFMAGNDTPDSVVSSNESQLRDYVETISLMKRLMSKDLIEVDDDVYDYAKRRYVPELGGWYRTKKK